MCCAGWRRSSLRSPRNNKQRLFVDGTEVPFGALLVAHRVVGICLLFLGDFVESLPHIERTIELYDPAEHRQLATRFGTDARAHALCYRSWTLWLLGYPNAAILDARDAVHGAREMGLAGTLMNTLALTSFTYVILRGLYDGQWAA